MSEWQKKEDEYIKTIITLIVGLLVITVISYNLGFCNCRRYCVCDECKIAYEEEYEYCKHCGNKTHVIEDYEYQE